MLPYGTSFPTPPSHVRNRSDCLAARALGRWEPGEHGGRILKAAVFPSKKRKEKEARCLSNVQAKELVVERMEVGPGCRGPRTRKF